MKLAQLIAVANGKKSRAQAVLSSLYHKLQKTALLDGIERTYQPKDDEGDRLPPESKRVQVRASDAVEEAANTWRTLWNFVGQMDLTNCEAHASIIVEGVQIADDVPVSHLLFLEKQLNDVRSFVDKLPTLDPAEEWELNVAANCFATPVHQTTKTKKVPRNHVKAEATKEHPAQVELFNEDVVVGTWNTTRFSGAIPQLVKTDYLHRVQLLQDAVKIARETANAIDTAPYVESSKLVDFVFKNSAGSA